ncbi:MAG TPA: class I SAM-dependent methyltransferase [Firmicutes bacterium]|nr:class I SAM-dependent methyltransferase [Bacillota bacterium]
MRNRDYFNAMAEQWDSMVAHDAEKITAILALVKIPAGSRILDVGTGTGVMIPYLCGCAGPESEITAVDEAEKMIAVAKKKYSCCPNVRFIAGDVLKIPLPAAYFDCIMCYSMFPHFKDKQAAVKKLSTYLKKGGSFVIAHSQSREAINNLHQKAGRQVKDDRLPPLDIIRSYYHAAGLEITGQVDDDRMFVVIGRKA